MSISLSYLIIFIIKEDIYIFPSEDLRTINQLWLHYSKGKFGFSVQAEIYRSLGGTREYNEEVLEKFGDRVGWRKARCWLSYNDLTFNIDALKGHLPIDYIGDEGGFDGDVLYCLYCSLRPLLSRQDL